MNFVKKLSSLFLLSSFLLACAPATPDSPPPIVDVYATPAAQPWLTKLFDCAASASATLNVTPDAPDILLRLGEPQGLSTPAFQVDTEEILIVVNRLNPLGNLTLEQARALFAGAEQGDASLQVWVYAQGQDVQGVFDQAVMEGRSVASNARLAVTPQQMSDALNSNVNALGILPRHWKMGDTREVLNVASVPVLAITPSEPVGIVRDLSACLQN
jgi:hypothetical protein